MTDNQQQKNAFSPVASIGVTAATVMTKSVISVSPETEVRQVAQLLLAHGISAVPVITAAGDVVGMISEGDLFGRRTGPDQRRDWWLALLADGQKNPVGEAPALTVDQAMAAPVITVGPDTPVQEIAQLLQSHRIKRVPVLEGGKVVGIISRADLLGVVATLPAPTEKTFRPNFIATLVEGLFAGSQSHAAPAADRIAAVPPQPDKTMSADAFRGLEGDSRQAKVDAAAEAKHAVQLARSRQAKLMLEQHVSAELWRQLLDHARTAAANGAKEFMLLQFPLSVCADGGRAINTDQPDWASTLRGEPAEIYLRWVDELKPQGFGLDARTALYDGDIPTEAALFLTWGE